MYDLLVVKNYTSFVDVNHMILNGRTPGNLKFDQEKNKVRQNIV